METYLGECLDVQAAEKDFVPAFQWLKKKRNQIGKGEKGKKLQSLQSFEYGIKYI